MIRTIICIRVNTTIAGGVACVTSVAVAYMRLGYVDITAANNGVLGGLVAITAGYDKKLTEVRCDTSKYKDTPF